MPFLRILLATALATGCATTTPAAHADLPDGPAIEQWTGLKGKMDSTEGVFKVSYPRADLRPQVHGMTMTPPQGLTAWAAFTRVGGHTATMGDMVVTEDQVNPVMDVALKQGLEVTALHNHFLWEQPRIMFMHIGGMGDEETLAKAVGEVFKQLKVAGPQVAPDRLSKIKPGKSNLNTKVLSDIIGAQGDLTDGVFKITIGRTTNMHGHSMGKTMGVNTWAAFAGSDSDAVVDGDFAMLEEELQNVLKALRSSGIQIVSIHNHMTMEQPRIIFLHYWGVGPAQQLAEGIRKALDTQKQ